MNVSTIRYNHQVARSLIPVSSTQILLVGFDRHFYEYKLSNGVWEFSRDFTSDHGQKSKKENVENNSDKQTEEKNSSIFDRMKMFDQSHQIKKASILVSNDRKPFGMETLESIHNSAVVSFGIRENSLITTDLSGFVKEWSL